MDARSPQPDRIPPPDPGDHDMQQAIADPATLSAEIAAPDAAAIVPVTETDVPEVIAEPVVSPPGSRRIAVLRYSGFGQFWLARLLSQTAQNALIYGLLVLVVDQTDSTLYNSLFVLCALLPSVVFGLPAGLAVDALPKRPLMIALNFLRCVLMIMLVATMPNLTGIFAAAMAIWTIWQFYAPAEGSMVAALLPPEQLTGGQAMSNLALTLAQALGMIVLAPLALKTGEPRVLFGLAALLFAGAMILVALLPRAVDSGAVAAARRIPGDPGQALLRGWAILRASPVLTDALAVEVLTSIGLSALVVLAPIYLRGILNTGAENTVFVFAPAALGLLAGLRLAPRLTRNAPSQQVALWSLFFFGLSISLFGFINPMYAVLDGPLHLPIDTVAGWLHVPPRALLVMFLSIPAGFFSSVAGVSARSTVLRYSPDENRGQVLATTSLVQNLGAIVPTLLTGILAQMIGLDVVAVLVAVVLVAGAVVQLRDASPAPGTAPATD